VVPVEIAILKAPAELKVNPGSRHDAKMSGARDRVGELGTGYARPHPALDEHRKFVYHAAMLGGSTAL
jgi:hypothetical protein